MKFCIGCAGRLVELRSQSKTFCPNCTEFKDWPLEHGQPSLTGDRIGGVTEETHSGYTNATYRRRGLN